MFPRSVCPKVAVNLSLMRSYLPLMILGACSAPPTAPPGEPAAPTPFDEPRPDATLPEADRPPTPEEAAAAAQPEPPPSEADIVAAQDRPPAEPAPAPLPPSDEAVTDAASWAEGAATPPYSGWTRAAGLTLLGLGGDALVTLQAAGVRVEVLSQDGDRLNVQCIGCPAPWANAGGWLPAEAVQPMLRAVDPDSPLAALVSDRVAWGRSAGSVPQGLSRHALCRLADQGYTQQGDTATWAGEADGGPVLTATRTNDGGWALDTSRGPTAGTGAWRCPLTPPAG